MITKGTPLKSKLCPKLIGKVKKLCGKGTALIEITSKCMNNKEMLIRLENWEEVTP